MSQDLSKVDAVLLSDGWHMITPGSFTLTLDEEVNTAFFTFTVAANPTTTGVSGDGTVSGPWSSVEAWRSPC